MNDSKVSFPQTQVLLNIVTSLEYSDTPEVLKGKDALQQWNEEVEQTIIDSNSIGKQINPYSCPPTASVEDTAHNLQCKLFPLISKHSPALFCRETVEDEVVAMSPLLSLSAGGNDEGATASCFETDEEANQASLYAARSLLCRHEDTKPLGVDADDQCALVEFCAQLMRTCKNVIRWNRILVTNASKMRKPDASSAAQNCTPSASSIARLCSVGMVQLYLSFIESNSRKDHDQEGAGMREKCEALTQAHDDLARHAALALFHATYGHAREPCCKKALVALVDNRQINGIKRLMRLLVAPNATPVVLGLVKIVHNLVGSLLNMMSQMDAALSSFGTSLDTSSCDASAGVGTTINLFSILIATLAWTIRSQPPFPGESGKDRRADLAAEILRVLFALRSGGTAIKRIEAENPQLMTQLGVILVEILRMPNRDRRCYECKLAVVILLIDSPVEYGPFLVVNHAIEELLCIFWIQLNETVVERAGMVQSERHAATILPVLIVLNELSKAQPTIRRMIKEYIFPPDNEDEFATKVQAQLREEQMRKATGTEDRKKSSKNMHPLDAPQGTTRWKLIKLMTYTESNVKRCSGELLWTLCGKDSQEFVLRCGFGNAVHLLGIKGLYKIPR